MRHIATDEPFRLTLYKTGAVVHFPINSLGGCGNRGVRRGGIHDQSKRSRIRCAFAFSNAQRDWGAMVTLTFSDQPKLPKEAFKKFGRAFRDAYGDGIQWGWIMEFQRRGVIHFHCFFERAWFAALLDANGDTIQRVRRHRRPTDLVRGATEAWFVGAWTKAVGDKSAKFLSFQNGGIVELLRTPDAASRYVAKECGKRAQKELPRGVEAAGRWWWLAPCGRPVEEGEVEIARWPYRRVVKLIFDYRDALKKEKSTPLWRHEQAITSYNICVAKSRATMRLRSEKGNGDDHSESLAVVGGSVGAAVIPNELFDCAVFGTPDMAEPRARSNK